MNKEIKRKLVALEAEVDAVLFRRNMYGEEEEQQGMGVGTALKVGAGLGALGAGAYGAKIGDQAIRRKYGMMPGVGRRESYRRAGMDAMDAVKGYGASAKTAGTAGMAAGKNAFYANASKGGGMLRGLWGGLRKGLRVMSGGRIRLSEIEARLVEMTKAIDGRLEFAEKSRLQGAATGGAIGAIGAGGAMGGLLAASNTKSVMRSPAMQASLRRVARKGASKQTLKVITHMLPAYAAGKYGTLGLLGGMGIGALVGKKKSQ